MLKYVLGAIVILGIVVLGFFKFDNGPIVSPTPKISISPKPTSSTLPSASSKPTKTPSVPIVSKTPTSTPTVTPVPTSTPISTPVTPTSSATPTITPTPTPQPTIVSIYPNTISPNQYFWISGANFIVNGVNQISAVKVGQWSMPGFSVQDDHTILTSMQVSYTGTFDVSIVTIDGVTITLLGSLIVR